MKSSTRKLSQQKLIFCEIETTDGLEFITRLELTPLLQRGIIKDVMEHKGAITGYCADINYLLQLKTASAIYKSDFYAVPRPKALLGHQHFQRILNAIELAKSYMPLDAKTFYISAAGADSSVMTRIKQEIAQTTGLSETEQGDVFLRIRRVKDGWDVLTRLSQRPLATRTWRVCNMQGALNAPLAHAMIMLTKPRPTDKFLNVACGSGTLLIERLAHLEANILIGCDISQDALTCASENISQAGYNNQIQLIEGSGMYLPLPNNAVDVICADLPFGQLVGSHEDNMQTYPTLLREMARVLTDNGRAVIISHELKLMDSLMTKTYQQALGWTLLEKHQVIQRGLHPCIYVLRK